MAKFLVKCWSEWHKGYHSILVEAVDKESAKNYIRSTEFECGGWIKKSIHLTFVPVGAREVEISEDGRTRFVQRPKKKVEHEKEAQKKQPFSVTFISKKDGREKTTVVKATDARSAKDMVKSFGRPVKASRAKGQR